MNALMTPIINLILTVLSPLDGYKTWISGIALICMAAVALINRDAQTAGVCVAMALTAFGSAHKGDKILQLLAPNGVPDTLPMPQSPPDRLA
ncbi:MAG: hypothetical protein K2R98_08430 [Gemmataceae bacterium]|nr:hypothetical protein [Gemmataceae bacterium]